MSHSFLWNFFYKNGESFSCEYSGLRSPLSRDPFECENKRFRRLRVFRSVQEDIKSESLFYRFQQTRAEKKLYRVRFAHGRYKLYCVKR